MRRGLHDRLDHLGARRAEVTAQLAQHRPDRQRYLRNQKTGIQPCPHQPPHVPMLPTMCCLMQSRRPSGGLAEVTVCFLFLPYPGGEQEIVST
jgi:hypothetical protein